MDFGELKDDATIREKLENFHNSVDDIERLVEKTLNEFDFDSLSVEDKVNYDLFVAYLLNTCYWMYLRTKGVNPNENQVKTELARVKEYMVKAKQAHDRNTIRPILNKAVAQRFIKHGINNSEKQSEKLVKKRKRTD